VGVEYSGVKWEWMRKVWMWMGDEEGTFVLSY
jgi:hypothetical protein